MITTPLRCALLAITLLSPALLAADDDLAETLRPFYPLATCIVDGEGYGASVDEGDGAGGPTEEPPIEVIMGERLFQVCSSDCAKTLRAQADRFAARLDEAIVQAQLPDYPLSTCPLSDEPLPANAQLVILDSRLVKLCCKSCLHSLRIDPEPAFTALDAAAIAAQKADYPLKNCPISGKPLGDTPRDVLHGAQLVRLCCDSCVRKFEAAPAAAVATVRAALPEPPSHEEPLKHGPIQSLKRASPSDAPTGRRGR